MYTKKLNLLVHVTSRPKKVNKLNAMEQSPS